jgi:uncharacterized protein (DUF2147 family)
LFGWFNTTMHHDLHHQDGRSNYGLYFTWWDRWMGTENTAYQARVAEIAERARARRKTAGLTATSTAALGLLVFAAAISPPNIAHAQAAGVDGNWATRGFGSIVQFQPCVRVPDTMCGRIIWLWEPNDEHGRPRADGRNPDRALRTRSLIGVEIARGLRQIGPGIWGDGALYNPDDGRTYTGAIRLRDGALELRGCALGVLCQTQIWRRPEDVLAAVRRLPQ